MSSNNTEKTKYVNKSISGIVKNENVRTESDAVHPRFAAEDTEEEINDFHRQHDYFCESCKVYFAPTVLGLREHFRPGRIPHISTKKCVYCKGPVFEYSLKDRTRVYHDCEENE